jgi:hypothetical protein
MRDQHPPVVFLVAFLMQALLPKATACFAHCCLPTIKPIPPGRYRLHVAIEFPPMQKGAVVGTPGGGEGLKSEYQPHAKQIAYAPQPAMRRADAEREPT